MGDAAPFDNNAGGLALLAITFFLIFTFNYPSPLAWLIIVGLLLSAIVCFVKGFIRMVSGRGVADMELGLVLFVLYWIFSQPHVFSYLMP